MRPLILVVLFFFSTELLAQNLATTSILPWSARLLRTGSDEWRQQDLMQTMSGSASSLFSDAADLKVKNDLRCGNNSSIFDTSLPSLGNTKVTTRFRYDPVSRSMTLDAFVKDGGQYREVLRSSYSVYQEDTNLGQLQRISMLNVQNQQTSRMGFLNKPFLTAVAQALGANETPIETNSPFARDWIKLLQDAEKGYVCCFNQNCREHLQNLAQPPAPQPDAEPGEIRRAESGERSAT